MENRIENLFIHKKTTRHKKSTRKSFKKNHKKISQKYEFTKFQFP